MTRAALIAGAIFTMVLLSRVPFAAQTLWAHDSVLYANAIEQGFHVDDDLFAQRPQPPGYILYLGWAGVLSAAGLSSNAALVAVSAIASALTAALLFLLLRRWTSTAAAIVGAMGYAASPLVWQYSEIAYPYAVLGLGSVIIAWRCVAARGAGLRSAAVTSGVFGLVGGFRQDLLLLLLPLWLWSVLPLGPRRAAVAAASLGAACGIWLLPTMALSGGPDEYLSALTSQAGYVGRSYSVGAQGLPALAVNLTATASAVGWSLLMVAPVIVAALFVVARRARRTGRGADALFLSLWCLPPLTIYVVLHIGDAGYVLSAVPALFVAGTRALAHIADRVPRARRITLGSASLAFVAIPGLLFVLSPIPFSAATIARHDRELVTRTTYVREQYAPRSTLILTREDFLLVRYYLPEYRARQYDPEPFVRMSRRMRTTRIETIVVFTSGLVPERQPDVRRVRSRTGVEVVYMDILPGTVLEFHGERYSLSVP